MGLPNGKKSIENLEKIIENLYLRLYNIERNEKTNISMMPTASSQIFEKIFNRFLRVAHHKTNRLLFEQEIFGKSEKI